MTSTNESTDIITATTRDTSQSRASPRSSLTPIRRIDVRVNSRNGSIWSVSR
jgi:hypothetical protein